jgi:hypothetical protein
VLPGRLDQQFTCVGVPGFCTRSLGAGTGQRTGSLGTQAEIGRDGRAGEAGPVADLP